MLSFLIFPLVFGGKAQITPREKKLIFGAFTAGILLIIGYAAYEVFHHEFFQKGLETGRLKKLGLGFYAYKTLGLTGFHPAYLGMHLTLATVFSFSLLPQKKYINIALKILLGLALAAFLFVISARAALLALLIAAFSYIFFHLKYALWKKTSISLLLLALFSIGILSNSRFQIWKSKTSNFENLKKKDSRIQIWMLGAELFSENVFFGVGTGDKTDQLFKRYEETGLEKERKERLMAHNQFLEAAIGIGLVGLTALVVLLLIPFLYFNKQNLANGLLLIVIFSTNLLFESMLCKITGIVLYAFFIGLLFIAPHTKKVLTE